MLPAGFKYPHAQRRNTSVLPDPGALHEFSRQRHPAESLARERPSASQLEDGAGRGGWVGLGGGGGGSGNSALQVSCLVRLPASVNTAFWRSKNTEIFGSWASLHLMTYPHAT